MKINVKLHGTMLGKSPPKGYLEVPDNTRVGDLLRMLGVDPEEAGVIIVDGGPASSDDLLKAGAEINIFNEIFGG